MSYNEEVLIVGSGPSAAYAVLACEDMGVPFRVVSNKPSNTEQAGAFFLHWLPRSLPAEPTPVRVFGTGHREGYLTKQWGPEFENIPTSFPEREKVERWYSSLALNAVWERTPVHLIGAVSDASLQAFGDMHRAVFHTFTSQVHANTRRLVRFPTLTRQQGPVAPAPGADMVIYNGDLCEAHARTTIAFGRLSIEFPQGTSERVLADYKGAFQGKPELVYLRDIPPGTPPVEWQNYLAPNVVPIGRFATWDRGVLSHQAYQMVVNVLREVL